jgi:hypothetical protein
MLRGDESYLSVNWLESTGATSRAQQIVIVRQHLTAKGMKLPANGRFAVLHLQTAFDHVQSRTPDSRRLTAHHEPDLPHDPSHSGIYGFTYSDDLIADLLAEAVHEIHKARQTA